MSDNISKCHRAFFAYGKTGILQGKPNPLTSRQIVEACVFPVLLYGCENWNLNVSLISSLETCQAQLGKKILRLPKSTANVVPCLALHWPSVQTRILIRKLCFLRKCIQSVAISGEVLRSMISCGSVPTLVDQCKFLEQPLGTNYTDQIMAGTESDSTLPTNREIREKLMKMDMTLCKRIAAEHESLKHFNFICESSSWMALWDTALDHSERGTSQSLALLRGLTQPIFGDRRCPLQHVENINCTVPPNVTALEHFNSEHNISDIETIITSVIDRHSSLFLHGEQLLKLYHF